MTTQRLCGQNVVPLISIVIALVVFANSLASIGSKNEFRAVSIGFIILLAVAIINLLRLIRKRGSRGIACVAVLLCTTAAVVLGYHLFS